MAAGTAEIAGLSTVGTLAVALISAVVTTRLTSTSERDENERQAARQALQVFQTQTERRLGDIEVGMARLATSSDVNRVVEKVGQVESKVAGIASLMSLVDPRLKPGGLADS